MAENSELVDEYVSSRRAEISKLMGDLRTFIHDTLPGATEDMQYGVPVFINTHGVPVVYLFGSKKHVNFGFLRSAELDDPHALLKGSGKPSKHLRVEPDKPVDLTTLKQFVTQCAHIRP